jgi:folate-dependent phosphoribosylglycinamide formyltransferase PurN
MESGVRVTRVTEGLRRSGRVVVLAGPGEPTHIVHNYLAARFADVVVVMEQPVPRLTLARRRAARLGWPTVLGQVAFVTIALPLLRRFSRDRVRAILGESGLEATADADIVPVASVNDPATADVVRDLEPAVVVVQGTRIISDATLASVPAPFINVHAGITPQYRGVHGGYWALVDGRLDRVGTTVHLVDTGIDTGGVLARAFFTPEPGDSIATYPFRHLADGLPLLAEQVGRVLAGEDLRLEDPLPDGHESRLRWHPTLWGYLWTRLTKRVR